MLAIWNHYNGRRGEFRSFELPAEVVSYGSITDYVPGNYIWRYAGPGSVEDLPCGGHNISLTLETVPPTAASVVGADLFLRLRLSAGAADGGEYVPGINQTITMSVAGGNAFVALNGINETISITLDTTLATGDVLVDGVEISIFILLNRQSAANDGALGINEAIALSLAPGAAEYGDLESLDIGQAYGGGFFAGYISHNANGVATHALIVAPAASGASTGYAWKTTQTLTSDSGSTFDGAANTAAMVAADIALHPAAQFCVNLSIGGFTDWYLPARYELDIAYSNLKPTSANNNNGTGVNIYSVPRRDAGYTTTNPTTTSVAAFQSGGSEAFIADDNSYWSSTEGASNSSIAFNFSDGTAFGGSKISSLATTRAFRRIALP
jgi:hypothetical protein